MNRRIFCKLSGYTSTFYPLPLLLGILILVWRVFFFSLESHIDYEYENSIHYGRMLTNTVLHTNANFLFTSLG